MTGVAETITRDPVPAAVISPHRAARLLLGGVGLLLVFSACSSDSSPRAQSAEASTTSAATGTPVAPSSSADPLPSTTVAVPVTPAQVDGAALLQQAVAATGAGYHFNQTATVDGVVAVTIDGDRLPDGTRFSITNEAGVVSYIYNAQGVWLMPENGEWEADDSPPAAVDPIAALAAPTSVTVVGNDGTTVQLVVTVPLALLGISGDGDASLQVAVVNSALSSIAYTTTTAEGKTAAATTAIGPVVDPSPVVAPI